MIKINIILKYTFSFALLLPIIQATQLYILFDIFRPILLIMPLIMGITTGFLVGYNRFHVIKHIEELEKAKESLTKQVAEQTRELQKKNQTLSQLIMKDSLTGLGNRIMLKETLVKESQHIVSDYDELSLFMIDIDYFKKYNDFYGHLMGDEVLIAIGQYFQNIIKNTNNTAIRFGGEEFIIILPNCSNDEAKLIAKKFVDGIKNLHISHQKSEVSSYVTISLGICTTSIINAQDCQCLKKADEALYKAKEQGRNSFSSLI